MSITSDGADGFSYTRKDDEPQGFKLGAQV